MNSPWTPERKAQLSQLWNDGLSASRIGAEMGTTKAAISGMARRLDLPYRRPRPHRPAKPAVRNPTHMTKGALLDWFRQAAPGERISYYTGNLAFARHNRHAAHTREVVELADAARSLGTPKEYVVRIKHHLSSKPEHGQGLAHLSQSRIAVDSYLYFITKAAKVVVT